jgi:hypothetical protein
VEVGTVRDDIAEAPVDTASGSFVHLLATTRSSSPAGRRACRIDFDRLDPPAPQSAFSLALLRRLDPAVTTSDSPALVEAPSCRYRSVSSKGVDHLVSGFWPNAAGRMASYWPTWCPRKKHSRSSASTCAGTSSRSSSGAPPLAGIPPPCATAPRTSRCPPFERWNQAGRIWYDTTKTDLTLENLNKTLLTRVSRAFHFRDSVFALSTTMLDHEPEEMLCELDSLLLSLVGAFDAAARIVDLLLHLNSGRSVGWQYTKNKEWQPKLEPIAKNLYDYTKDGSEMQRTFQVLRWLRNSVHNKALDPTRDDGAFYITTETETQDKLRDFLREGHPGWTTATLGAKVQPPGGATQGKWLPGTGRYSVTVRRTGAPRPADPLDGTLVFDVRRLVNKLFPACLSDLNAIMRLAPLTQVPGYRTALDNPSRVNLPWRFSDTTGHRLRMLYGIAEPTKPFGSRIE